MVAELPSIIHHCAAAILMIPLHIILWAQSPCTYPRLAHRPVTDHVTSIHSSEYYISSSYASLRYHRLSPIECVTGRDSVSLWLHPIWAYPDPLLHRIPPAYCLRFFRRTRTYSVNRRLYPRSAIYSSRANLLLLIIQQNCLRLPVQMPHTLALPLSSRAYVPLALQYADFCT